jgi:hypothetical protein
VKILVIFVATVLQTTDVRTPVTHNHRLMTVSTGKKCYRAFLVVVHHIANMKRQRAAPSPVTDSLRQLSRELSTSRARADGSHHYIRRIKAVQAIGRRVLYRREPSDALSRETGPRALYKYRLALPSRADQTLH